MTNILSQLYIIKYNKINSKCVLYITISNYNNIFFMY